MGSLGLLEVFPPPEDREDRSAGQLSVSSEKLHLEKNPTTEKKQKSWYYASMYPSYKTRKGEFRQLFPDCHKDKFVVDYSCAYHKDILHQGRMYVTTTAACFYSSLFGWEQRLTLDWRDVTAITKEKTAIFIPNAIQLTTKDNKFFFASLVDRDSSFLMLVRFWQAATAPQGLGEEDLDQIIALNYGEGEEEEEVCSNSPQVPPVTWQEEQEELPGRVQEVLDNWMQQVGGSIVCDQTLSRPLSEVYSLLYTNSNFFFTFHKDQGSTELEIGDWEEQDEGEEGDRVREVSYNMSLNNPVGPKKCQVKEVQRLRAGSVIEGGIYCIETEAENSGVPYADSFSVVTNSCLVALGEDRARFIAKAEITFKKDLWSFLKDKIEANAWSGITSYYAQLAASLESYSALLPEQARASSREARGGARPSAKGAPAAGTTQGGGVRPQEVVLYILVLLLLVTSVLNFLALQRLSLLAELEEPVSLQPGEPLQLHLDTEVARQPHEWLALLERQAKFYSQRTAWLRRRLVAATAHLIFRLFKS